MVDVGSKMRPEMKVLFMSGYTDVLASTHTIVGVSHSFIQKPFAKADLLEKVSRLLHSPAPAGGQESVPGILGRPAEMKGVVAKGALPPSVSEGRTKSAHDEDSLTRRLEGKPRLLVIDDDPSVGEFVQSLAERWGYSVTIALSGASAVGIATDFRPDIALVDYKMPEMDGLETIHRLRSVAPDTSSIMITAFADLAVATQALRQSAFDFLTKPFTPIELDRALRRAIQHREVQRRERRQRSLLAVLSHELRSNLQAPLRFLSSLSSGIYGPIRDEHRQPILRALKGVATEARVVDNLLDVRYLESDQLTLRRVIYSVRALVQEVIDSFEIQIADGGVTLVWSPPSEPFLVQVDAERLKRAIANVLSNGLEHTSPGRSVEVRLCRVGSALHCCIRDEGPGIAEAYLERIFERDFQVPSSPGKAQGGLGIGLYIARQILRAHGGDVRAASVVDQGSTFAIILPCEDSSGEASSNA
jgi:signal transduction histidine kinase